MPLYLIERNFAEQVAVNAEEDVRWLVSFLTGDKRKSYCLYEAESPEAIRAAARRANVPADVIIEVERFDPALLR
jgi:Protein of unknown function (DUF4242)